jgi:Protein of unknown function (DUF3574)
MRGLVLAAALLLGGCAAFSPSCPAGLQPMTTAALYFGRAMADGPGVSDQDWQHFLDEEVTPRFPDGLTVEDASGQWKSTNGAIVHEASKILTIVLPDAVGAQAKLAAIREAYRRRFHQESVLISEYRSCSSF